MQVATPIARQNQQYVARVNMQIPTIQAGPALGSARHAAAFTVGIRTRSKPHLNHYKFVSQAVRRILPKLRALVFDILPPTTAIVDYAIGLKKNKKKLSANEQFLDDAQTAVSL